MLARSISALAAAGLMLATPALAQDSGSVSVNTADLDLSSASGRAALDQRVRKAANQICDNGSSGMHMTLEFATCRNSILASANQQVTQLASRNDGRIQLARAR